MKTRTDHETRILIVGAGLAGLTAAADLRRRGYDVLVVDKGRGVGGRLATRRIGEATFDQGAQFMTARDPRFAALVGEWVEAGAATQWFVGSDGSSKSHSRWRGVPAMTGIAKYLAGGTRVLLETRIEAIRADAGLWHASGTDGTTVSADALLLTAPVPQSLALVEAGGVTLRQDARQILTSIDYDPCIAVMAVLDGPSAVPPPGGMEPPDEAVAWIADNQQKGVSAIASLTIHAAADFSRRRWDSDRRETGLELLRAAEPWLGSRVSEFQVHGWLYSKPTKFHTVGCVISGDSPPLVFAGDAFVQPRAEGAAVSGWAAAQALSGALSKEK